MAKYSAPLDPDTLILSVDKFGFQYRNFMGMLLFAVQIGRFDIAPAVAILCKYNDRPDIVHFQAAKIAMRYLRTMEERGKIYWYPTGQESPDLARGTLPHFHPAAAIGNLFPMDFSLLDQFVTSMHLTLVSWLWATLTPSLALSSLSAVDPCLPRLDSNVPHPSLPQNPRSSLDVMPAKS
jgi:hypothetical protein